MLQFKIQYCIQKNNVQKVQMKITYVSGNS